MEAPPFTWEQPPAPNGFEQMFDSEFVVDGQDYSPQPVYDTAVFNPYQGMMPQGQMPYQMPMGY